MDCGLSPDHHLQERGRGPPGTSAVRGRPVSIRKISPAWHRKRNGFTASSPTTRSTVCISPTTPMSTRAHPGQRQHFDPSATMRAAHRQVSPAPPSTHDKETPCTPPSATTWPRPGPPDCAARPSEAHWPAPPATRERTSSSMPHLGSQPQGAACSPPCAPRHLTSLPHRRLANALRRSECHLLRARRVEQKFHRCSSPSSSYRRCAFGDSRDSRANSPDAHQAHDSSLDPGGCPAVTTVQLPPGSRSTALPGALIAANRRRAFRARGH
jgi:hypothetical protein